LLKQRALAACAADRELGRRGLSAELNPGDDPWDVDIAFVRPDGLGATLDDGQRAASRRIQTALERARVHLGNPYALATFRQELGTPVHPMPLVEGVPTLSVLLFGPATFERAGSFFSGQNACGEVEEALDRHLKAVG